MTMYEELINVYLDMDYMEPVFKVIKKYQQSDENSVKNEFVIVLKPEIFLATKPKNIIEFISNKLSTYDVNISAVYASNGRFNALNSVFENHYFVLNRGAQYGFDKLPHNYKKTILSKHNDSEVISAYGFLKANKDKTAEWLQEESHKSPTEKIGNGTYLYNTFFNGKKYSIINAFHPYQIEHFSKEDHMTVFMICRSNTNYKVLAEELIGHFDPRDALEGSIRKYLFDNRFKLSFDFSTIFNGTHITPSSFEALSQISRLIFFDTKQIFDRKGLSMFNSLLDEGIKPAEIDYLLTNPIVNIENGTNALFDVLEGKDNKEITKLIKKLYINKHMEVG